MSKQTDWTKEREAIRVRVNRIASGLDLVSTIDLIAICRRLLAHAEEDQREIAEAHAVLNDADVGQAPTPNFRGGRSVLAWRISILADHSIPYWKTRVASRDQRITQLESELAAARQANEPVE